MGSPGLGFPGCKRRTRAQRAAQVPGSRDPEACPGKRVRSRQAGPTAGSSRPLIHASARATARLPAGPPPWLSLAPTQLLQTFVCLAGSTFREGRSAVCTRGWSVRARISASQEGHCLRGGGPPAGREKSRGRLGSCDHTIQELEQERVQGMSERELFVYSWNVRRGTVECIHQ